MILTAHQPAYLPWLGYFDKIARSDIFIFLDTVQFEKNSFINRNKIKTPNGPIWLTIPVLQKGHTDSTLLETKIYNTKRWKVKHLRSIHMNYSKAKFFEINYPKLQKLYSEDYDILSDLCYYQLLSWLKELNIKTEVIRSSKLGIYSKKSDLILDLCRHFNATEYISGILGKNYLEESKFEKNKIKILYQKYKHPVYEQLYGDFVPNMSIVDFWMNTYNYDLI